MIEGLKEQSTSPNQLKRARAIQGIKDAGLRGITSGTGIGLFFGINQVDARLGLLASAAAIPAATFLSIGKDITLEIFKKLDGIVYGVITTQDLQELDGIDRKRYSDSDSEIREYDYRRANELLAKWNLDNLLEVKHEDLGKYFVSKLIPKDEFLPNYKRTRNEARGLRGKPISYILMKFEKKVPPLSIEKLK